MRNASRLTVVLCLLLLATAGARSDDEKAPKGKASASATAPTALEEVNALRKLHGLPPFHEDKKLTVAARRVAKYRAARLIEGHVNDFDFLPEGGQAAATGCAAWEPALGWGSCCTFERWRYAGAAWAMGRDGRRYMSLFVR
jgi:hypothetical protein